MCSAVSLFIMWQAMDVVLGYCETAAILWKTMEFPEKGDKYFRGTLYIGID